MINKRIIENNFTMLEKEAIKVLLDCVQESPNGTIVIAGTAHGGDAMSIRRAFPDRRLVVIDSFEGVGTPIDKDGPDAPSRGAHDNGGIEQYIENFHYAKCKLPHKLHKMWIDDQNIKRVQEENISMLFMDLDHYSPVKTCLNYFYPQLPVGGIILSHDYGFWKTKGVIKACQEFAPNKWIQIRGFGKFIKEG
jgi:hypothetical protein